MAKKFTGSYFWLFILTFCGIIPGLCYACMKSEEEQQPTIVINNQNIQEGKK